MRRPLLGQLPRGGLVVLAGIGGVGKSTVAAELARRARVPRLLRRPLVRQVWWISGATTTSLTAGMVSVARSLGASPADLDAIDKQAADAPDRLCALLEQARRRWLLLVDNADDPHLLAGPTLTGAGEIDHVAQVSDGTGWIRSGRRGLVVVTSRHGDQKTWGRHAVVHRLWPLSDREAGRVLRDLAPDAGGQPEAEALGRRLGGLPLALQLAGLNLGAKFTRWSTFDACREALDLDPIPARLLNVDADVDLAREQRAAVMRTWELSLDALAEHGLPQTRAVLRLLSCYAPALPIPLELLRRETLSPLLQGVTAVDGRDPEELLRALARLGLVESGQDQSTLVVHPVVADTNRAHLLAPTTPPDPDPRVVRETAIALMVDILGELDPKSPSNWQRYRQLAPHVLAMLQTTGSHVSEDRLASLLEAVSWVADAYYWAGSPASAATVSHAALALSARLSPDHPAILRLRYSLAVAITALGRWHETESAFREVLEAQQRVLGADHPHTLDTRLELAWAPAEQWRWTEVESALREVLEAQQRVLGPDHPKTLDTRQDIANVAAAQGRLKEGESALREVLEAKQRVLGADHLSTLGTRHSIAWAVADQGRWKEAESGWREVLEAQQRVLGADHLFTLGTRHALAWSIANQGRWKEGESAIREALEEAQQRSLGADSPTALVTRTGLVTAAAATQGRWVADAHRWAALALSARFGPDHPGFLRGRCDIAFAIGQQGRWKEAESAYREILDAQQRILGADHPHPLDTRNSIAWAVAHQGRWDEAESALREVLEARQRVLGADHLSTLGTRYRLAWAVAHQGRWQEGESALHEVVEAQKRVLGADHPDTLVTCHDTAWAVANQGRLKEAESTLHEVVEAQQRVLGADHPHTLATRNSIAWVAANQGMRKEAESAYREVLEAQQRVLGADHPTAIATRQALLDVVRWSQKVGAG